MSEILLGDLCTIKSSKRIFESEYVDTGIPFIRGQEITDKSIGKPDARYGCYISNDRYNEIRQEYGVPQKGDVLITAVGTIGNLCYVDFDTPFYYKDGNVIQFTNFAKKVNPKYIYYFMQSPYFQKQIENALIGAVQKALTMIMLKKIHLVLPPIEQQNKIVSMLSAIDDKIALNELCSNELESMAKLIYNYWFIQFDFPGKNGKPYKSCGGKMVPNETLKREIPDGWNAVALNELVTMNNGINYDKNILGDKEYRIVNVRNISNTTLFLNEYDLDLITLVQKQADKYLVCEDDIIIARSGTPGAVRLFWNVPKDTVFCGFIIRLLPKTSANRLYITNALKLYEGTNATKTGGSILQNVSQDTLSQIVLCIPPKDIIEKYGSSGVMVGYKPPQPQCLYGLS